MIDPGKHDRRVTILRRSETQDDFGGLQVTWPTYKTIFASRREVTAREVARNSMILAEMDAVFCIRWFSGGIDATMRLKDEHDRIYDIKGVTELPGRNVGWEIRAKLVDRKAAAA